MWAVFQAIKRSWTQHFVEQFSAFVVMTMAYVALVFVAVSLTNVQILFDAWGQIQKVSVYLTSQLEDGRKKEIGDFLRSQTLVEEVQVVTSEESAQAFENRFAKASSQKIDVKQMTKFFPQYFQLTLNQNRAYKSNFTTLDAFAEKIKQTFSEVQSVSYGKNWIQRYMGVLQAINSVGWFLIFSFFVASLIISANVIKTVLYARRDEIEIMEFIGANDFSIYLPQVINALLLALMSFAVAVGINYGILHQVKTMSINFVSTGTMANLQFVDPMTMVSFVFLVAMGVSLYSCYTIFNLMPRRKKALIVGGVFR